MESTKIIMCKTCNGAGTIHLSELEDYHRSEYREWDEICTLCLGSGRLEETTTVKLEPYANHEIAKLTFKKLKD